MDVICDTAAIPFLGGALNIPIGNYRKSPFLYCGYRVWMVCRSKGLASGPRLKRRSMALRLGRKPRRVSKT